MRELIEGCRSCLGAAPRSFPPWSRLYLRPPAPPWLKRQPNDPIWNAYRDEPSLLQYGRIVWGHIIQANQLLFKPGTGDYPAEVLYGTDPALDDGVELLQDIAYQFMALKGTTPTEPGLEACALSITDETARSSGAALPEPLARGRALFHATLLVHQKHLPLGYLGASFFPLLAPPEALAPVMILPSRWWPPRLIELWRLIALGSSRKIASG